MIELVSDDEDMACNSQSSHKKSARTRRSFDNGRMDVEEDDVVDVTDDKDLDEDVLTLLQVLDRKTAAPKDFYHRPWCIRYSDLDDDSLVQPVTTVYMEEAEFLEKQKSLRKSVPGAPHDSLILKIKYFQLCRYKKRIEQEEPGFPDSKKLGYGFCSKSGIHFSLLGKRDLTSFFFFTCVLLLFKRMKQALSL